MAGDRRAVESDPVVHMFGTLPRRVDGVPWSEKRPIRRTQPVRLEVSRRRCESGSARAWVATVSAVPGPAIDSS